uniref:C2 domain-containing protein n=1 Tax=Schistocephalus solidus TaxID=70667 RepID=A0A0X3PJP8_SCHSO
MCHNFQDSSDESLDQVKDTDSDQDTSLNQVLSSDPKLKSSKSPSPQPSRSISNTNLQKIQHLQGDYEAVIQSMKAMGNLSADDSATLGQYERILTSLNETYSAAAVGKQVDLTSLPPPPPLLKKKEPSGHKSGQQIVLDFINKEDPPKSAPSSISAASLALLKHRHLEYRNAAVSAHKSGDLARAKQLMVAVKALDEAIPRIEAGEEPFDAEEDMPPPPDEFAPASGQSQPSSQTEQHPQSSSVASSGSGPLAAAYSPVVSKESLTARITILQMMLKNAQASNSPMAGMLRRTLGYYTEALDAFNQGIMYDYPGLAPVPNCPRFQPYKPSRAPGSASVPTTTTPQAPAPQSSSASRPAAPTGSFGAANSTPSQRVAELLKRRQQELRSAAAKAKAEGDMELAKKHLRASLSMNSMVQAAEAGLPVDLSQLPPAPGAKRGSSSATGTAAGSAGATTPILSGKKCEPPITFQTLLLEATSVDLLCDLLKTTLSNQAIEAEELSNSHRQAGVSVMADKLMTLSTISRQWITYVDAAQKRGRNPDYSFEQANLSSLNKNPDLGEDVLEVTVVRGISLPIPPGISGPEALDTYVTLELPYPNSDSPQKFSTAWARHTNQPTDYGGFEASARFTVNRKARSFERLLQGPKTLKATVYYNRGLLKKPGVLGTASVKLEGLLSSATSTSCYDLKDGRTAVGGMLEITLRHRSPLSGPPFHIVTKPWLIIQSSRSAAAPRVSPRK